MKAVHLLKFFLQNKILKITMQGLREEDLGILNSGSCSILNSAMLSAY